MNKGFRQRGMLLFLSLFAFVVAQVAVLPAAAQGAGIRKINKGVIAGRIMLKEGGPLAGGQVLFYNAASGVVPAPELYDRTPEVIRDIDSEGRFNVDLPAGKYYIGALKRTSDELIGPPRAGDIVFRSLDKKGRMKVYTVKAGVRIDVGTLSGAFPLLENLPDRGVSTGIEGRVVDTEGEPVAGAVVVAFLNPSLQNKPIFVSEKTGKDGRYIIRVTEGTYYLKARNSFASGPPEPGQIMGYYGEGAPEAITVRTGEIRRGVDFRVILFPGRGPFSGSAPTDR